MSSRENHHENSASFEIVDNGDEPVNFEIVEKPEKNVVSKSERKMSLRDINNFDMLIEELHKRQNGNLAKKLEEVQAQIWNQAGSLSSKFDEQGIKSKFTNIVNSFKEKYPEFAKKVEELLIKEAKDHHEQSLVAQGMSKKEIEQQKGL
jgi:hypothetical protein